MLSTDFFSFPGLRMGKLFIKGKGQSKGLVTETALERRGGVACGGSEVVETQEL